MPLPRINRDDVITADYLNQLAAAIEQAMDPSGGDGMVMRALASLRREDLVQCRIKAVRFDHDIIPPGPDVPDYPSLWTYDYIGIGRAGVKEEDATPVYGRPVRNDEAKIYPARVGMVCYLVRAPNGAGTYAGELMLLPDSEVPARRRCGGSISGLGLRGATSSKKPTDKIVEPDPPPPPPTPAQRYGFGQLGTGNETAEFTKGGDGVLGGDLGGGGIGTPGGEGGPGL